MPVQGEFPREIRVDHHLVLKASTNEEADLVAEIVLADLEHLGPFLPWATTEYTPESYVQWLESRGPWENGKWEFTIYRSNNEDQLCVFLGRISVWVNDSGCHEIGYWLARHACGDGVMSAAIRALEKELRTFGIAVTEIQADIENSASRRVAERAGYEIVGITTTNASNPGSEFVVYRKELAGDAA